MLFERKSLSEIFDETPELRVNGDWLCLNIEIRTAWPTKPQAMTFEGHFLWLMPHSTDHYAGLALNKPGNLDRDEAWALLHRALSLIAWTQDTGAMVTHMSGGNLPRMMGSDQTTGVVIRDSFDFSDLPQAQDDRGRLALALMREGRGLNHPAYAFLSFFRVLETAIPHAQARKTWVSDNLDNLQGQAKEALAKLKESVDGDIGLHLYASGRCAIAHAAADPIINPDDPRDAKRLQTELPIIKGLAVLAVEKHLGIQTSHTIWDEHLYELRGWRNIFGDGLVTAILAGDPPAEDQQINAPIINVRLRRSSTFAPLEGMRPLQAGFGHGRVEVAYQSEDGLVDLVFWLNFAEERLEFDFQQGIVIRDDGSVAAAQNGKEVERFFRDYLGNGELQMWDADTETLVSRCDAFIPINCYLDVDAANAAIAKWDEMIAERT